ncbi:MAG TPA: TetR/AcrR family transcriptional regulator [Solirubrobacteraceae bacterium]|nr:TetR/AcrR family transcriptional regulator [Solirubrobacteraceae bacterium]
MSPERSLRARAGGATPRVREEEILATTVELVREHGLSKVRVADVAERAGTSPTSVIYYFASKSQLFGQAVADADAAFYARLRPELAALQSGIDQLAWLIVRSSTSEWPLWIDTWLFARQYPELREAEAGFEQRWCAAIADAIRVGVSRGEFRCADPDQVAIRLAALTEGLAVHMVLSIPGRTREHYVEMSLRAAAAELGCDPSELLRAATRVPPETPPYEVQPIRGEDT